MSDKVREGEATPARFDICFDEKAGMFSGAGMPGIEGFHYGDRWNGWACPFFTKEAADKIIAADCWKGRGEFDAAANVYRTPYEEGGDEMDEWKAQTITVDGEPVEVWCIGGWSWTWEIIEKPAPRCEAPPKCEDCGEPLARCCGNGALQCLMCNPCPNCSDQ